MTATKAKPKRGRPLGAAHDKKTREKIQTSQLVNRLTNHVFGKCDMSSTQVRSAEVLLRKSLPDLQSVEITGDSERPLGVIMLPAKK